jgi:hypothetical protein
MSNNSVIGNCVLVDAVELAESLSRNVDDYVFVLRKEGREDDFKVTMNCEDVTDENLLLLYYAGEEIWY